MNDTIELRFMVASHTKEIVDCAFGHFERLLKTHNGGTPTEMILVIENKSNSICFSPSACVDWLNWKDFLQKLFKVPSSFQIAKYHLLSFTGS